MSSYDPTIFERSDTDFILSQRFKQHFHKFYGTLKVAVQMVSTNAVLNYFPRPLLYVIMFIYLSFGGILASHLFNQLCSKKKVSNIEDFDLIDVSKPRHIILSRLDRNDLIFMIFAIFIFVFHCAIVIEKLGIEFRMIYCAFIITFMLFYLVPKFAREITAMWECPN